MKEQQRQNSYFQNIQPQRQVGLVEANNITTPKKDATEENKNRFDNTSTSTKIHQLDVSVDLILKKKVIQYTGCNCTKSECLKMYCTCFSNGKMCDEKCLCRGCLNKFDNQQRSQSIVQIINKNAFAFSSISLATQNCSKGCNCTKSNCLKKYCECLRRGKTCGQFCKCMECKNCQESGQIGRKKQKLG